MVLIWFECGFNMSSVILYGFSHGAVCFFSVARVILFQCGCYVVLVWFYGLYVVFVWPYVFLYGLVCLLYAMWVVLTCWLYGYIWFLYDLLCGLDV